MKWFLLSSMLYFITVLKKTGTTPGVGVGGLLSNGKARRTSAVSFCAWIVFFFLKKIGKEGRVMMSRMLINYQCETRCLSRHLAWLTINKDGFRGLWALWLGGRVESVARGVAGVDANNSLKAFGGEVFKACSDWVQRSAHAVNKANHKTIMLLWIKNFISSFSSSFREFHCRNGWLGRRRAGLATDYF